MILMTNVKQEIPSVKLELGLLINFSESWKMKVNLNFVQ